MYFNVLQKRSYFDAGIVSTQSPKPCYKELKYMVCYKTINSYCKGPTLIFLVFLYEYTCCW